MADRARAGTFTELKQLERQARRLIIIEAAERVFADKPFNKAGMREIAREAGISPASIYRYFPDQQTLFVEAFLNGVLQLVSIVEEALERDETADLEKTAGIFIDYLTDNDHYFRMMTMFMMDSRLHPDLIARLNEIGRGVLDRLDRVFERLGCRRDPRLHSHAFFAALNGILITFRHYPGRSREEVRRHMGRVASLIARAFLSGMKERGVGERQRPLMSAD